MIVATAGHVGHGKSTLAHALTGVAINRRPEEQARGLTIDLGFGYTQARDGTITGVVDVPGHERFVANMLAGVAGIDAALLVVAADDGPMPQTLEHLAILDLLGVGVGVVAITKTDRVSGARVAEVEAAIRVILARSTLRDAPIIPLSAATGEGIERLREALLIAAPPRSGVGDQFRLAVDRVFVVNGVGLVATGTVLSGKVAIDDDLIVSPKGIPVRARGIHAQNRLSAGAGIGDRCAVNLAGPGATRESVRRGDWLVDPAAHQPTRRLDVRLRLALGEDGPLRHDTPVHVHIGAADVTGRVAILEGRVLVPGEERWCQLVLDRDIVAVHGDGFVLRDQSARRSIAGGRIVAPFGATRGRAKPERLATLGALAEPNAATALSRLLAESTEPIRLTEFRHSRNLSETTAEALWASVPMHCTAAVGVSRGLWRAWRDDVPRILANTHKAEPDRAGLAPAALRRAISPPPVPAILDALLRTLVAEGAVVFRVGAYRLPSHRPRLDETDAASWAVIEPLLIRAGPAAPVVHEIAKSLTRAPEDIRGLLLRAARVGLVLQVSKNRFLLPESVAALARTAEDAAALDDGRLTITDFRDRSGVGRNLAIEILEFFDARRLTRRIDNARRLIRRPETVFGGADP